MESNKVILRDSEEAAKFVTGISGWVSAKGHFYGKDESLARYDGMTHKKCVKCDALVEKEWAYNVCHPCLDIQISEKHMEKELIKYYPELVVVIQGTDIYCFNEESLFDYLSDNDYEAGPVHLEVCEPNHMNHIDVYGLWENIIPLDSDAGSVIDEDLLIMIDKVNEKIKNHAPLSWQPGKKRTVYEFEP